MKLNGRLLSILLAVSLIVSCTGVTPTPAPTPLPAPTGTPPATAAPTATAGAVPAPLGPIVIDYLPQPGEELAPGGTVRVFFDQPMNAQTVEAAFSISPTVTGSFAWTDGGRTLQFKPVALERERRYAVTVGAAAAGASNLTLGAPFRFNFNTVGDLAVSQVLPAPGTTDAATDATITVIFNRPVVPLTTGPGTPDLPQPLVIDPAVEGKGQWLNTAIYLFRPDKPYAAGATYRVTVKAGLTDVTGSPLVEDYTWTFHTLPPSVLYSSISNGETDVSLTPVISITFNQRMDHAATEAAFSLSAQDGSSIPGAFSWYYYEESETGRNGRPAHSEALGFRPGARLALDTRYLARVAQTARALDGVTLAGDYQISFRTVPYPAIARVHPSDGTRDAEPQSGLSIDFVSPMDMSSIMRHVSIIPAPTAVYTYGWDTSFYVNWDQHASTQYTVRLSPGMHDLFGNAITTTKTISFTTRAYAPEIYLNVENRVGTYNAYNDTRVYARVRNIKQIDVALYGLSLQDFIRVTNYSNWNNFSPRTTDLVRGWSETVNVKQNVMGYQELSLAGPEGGSLPPGLYFLKVTSPQVPLTQWYKGERHVLVVSAANLTVKTTLDEVLVWATDLQSGEPLAGAPVKLYSSPSGREIASGATGADGVWRTAYSGSSDLWSDLPFATLEDGTSVIALSAGEWSDGIEGWDFGVNVNYYPDTEMGYVYTERPIYRPGQTVYFKAILRADDDAHYTLPAERTVTVRVVDDEGREVYKAALPLTPYGAVSGQFELSDAASLGRYRLTVIHGHGDESSGVNFQVAEYHKPEFQVAVTTDRPEVVQGDTLHVDAQATYFFGGAVADAEVEYAVYTRDFYFYWSGAGWYDFNDVDPWAWWSGGGDSYRDNVVAQGSGRTDMQGHFTIDLPADLGDRTVSQVFTVDVTVTDLTGQEVSDSAAVTVHKGTFYAGLAPTTYVGVAGKEQTVDLLTVGWDGTPVPGQALQVTFMQHDWNCAMREDDSGNLVWRCDAIDTPVYTTRVTTGDRGRISATFTPAEGGTYRVQARGRDAQGHEISSSTYMWISSREYARWRQSGDDRIELVAGQRSYRPGDTAEILIPTPFEGRTTALVTVERGHILQHEVITLEGNSTIYRLPITPELAPNVFVSVVVVKGGKADKPADYRVGLIGLQVSNEQKQLTLTLTPDRTQAGPRDTVTYDVRATDYAGNPVQAEVSVGLIDLAVLSLLPPNAGPLLDSFYGERGLRVRTGVGLSLSVDRLNVKAAEEAKSKGGGGGGDEAGAMTVRQDFPDTAYWKADLVTGADGRAQFSVKLPDALTTWRLDARAVTADTLVGQATVDIVVNKPLMVRPVTPRFFVVGDVVTLASVVHNNTDKPFTAEVALTPTGVDLSSPAAQAVELPAGGKARVEWQITVQDVVAVDLTFSATGGGYQDASKPPLGEPPERLLPVYKYVTPETVGTAGVLSEGGTRTEAIVLPSRLDVTQGEVTVAVAPSLAATTLDGLTAVEREYGYECLEQALSRFVPNAVTYRALKLLKVKDPDLEARLPALIAGGLQRLYNEQHADGGWGWFMSYRSSVHITAYAMFGIVAAEEAGVAVDVSVKQRALDYLRGALRSPGTANDMYSANEQAWLLYVLARAGRGDASRNSAWYGARQKMGLYGRAYLALAMNSVDPKDTRVQSIMSDLMSAAIPTATGMHWEESQYDWWAMNTDTRTTAIILDAFARIDPDNTLLPNAVRWLMVAREGDIWHTTQETAWALIAFADYMAASGELDADYTWGVALNYAPVGTGTAEAGSLRVTTRLTIPVADLLRDAANRLDVQRSDGPGRLYYTAHLRAFLPVEDVQPESRGITVQREYFHALTPAERRLCTQTNGQDPVCTPAPITSAQVGDTIQVKLTLIVPHSLYYVYLEDPLPAGAEAIDTSLLTSSEGAERPTLEAQGWDFYWGWWYFGHTQLRDEKTVLYARWLPAGTYVYTYQIQASVAGEFHVMPAHAAEFYFPETWGRSGGALFTITDK